MSLVKWIRKNTRKIMVGVIIVAMVVFVIGQIGMQMIMSRFSPAKKTIATYDSGKISYIDRQTAQSDLNTLRMLNGDQLLARQGVGGMLLCRMIFPESPFVSNLDAQLKQAVQNRQLSCSVEELEAYFNQRSIPADMMWMLLKAEAQRAGYLVSSNSAKAQLVQLVPLMSQGRANAGQLISLVMQQTNQTEAKVVRTFADLLTVSDYANQIMNNQAVTLNQVKASLGHSKERLDAEFVKIDAETLVDETATIADADITAQFEAFKQIAPGSISKNNPYGFGYKLPKRVQLEYLIVKADDVKAQIEQPTSDELEQYYKTHIAQYQTEEPSDPNDPESEKNIVTQPFTEAEPRIRSSIEQQKTDQLTKMLFNEIKDITEKGFENITFDEATNAQLQEEAGDYEVTAKQIAEEHKITVTTGKTGWLSEADFLQNNLLRTLARQQGTARLPLSELAFIASTEPKQQRRIGLPAVRVWESIGPVDDRRASYYGEIPPTKTAIVRVIGIEEAAVAADINVQYDTTGVAQFETPEEKEDATFSLKEKVTEDLRLKKAMETAAARANELATLVANSDWTGGVKAYNDKYDANDPNNIEAAKLAVKLEFAKDQGRATQTEINFVVKNYMTKNPDGIRRYLANNAFNQQLYALLPQDAESTGSLTKVLTSEAGAACYVVKEVIRKPATEKDYLDAKAQTAMQLSSGDMAELALVHYSTENILKRMDFEYTDEDETPEAEEEAESSKTTE